MGNAYIYYSFEEYGRGYIGARSKSPIGDDSYMGSFRDKTFNPTQKIILAEYETWEEALEAEVLLHEFYGVARNPHFANIAKQTSSSFYFDRTGKTHKEETKSKISSSQKGKPRPKGTHTPESNKKRGRPGVPKSPEHRAAISASSSFRLPEIQAKAREARKGYRHSEETKRKLKDKAGARSEEAKQKLREYRTGRRWITNGTESKTIGGEEQLPDGWRFGRG